MAFLLIDQDGFRYWGREKHGREVLYLHMSIEQRLAVKLLEKWGYTLLRLYDDGHREAVLSHPKQNVNTVVGRM